MMETKQDTEKKSIYRKEALERLSQPEQMNDYIRVTTPGVWVVMIALVSALLGLLAWGVFGSIVVTSEVRGVAQNGKYICYVEDASGLEAGMQATVGDSTGTVKSVAQTPTDSAALMAKYAPHIWFDLELPRYVYEVTLDIPDGGADGVFDARIVTQRIRPISLVLGSAQ